MKIGIILLSILATAGAWWWNVYRLGPALRPTFTQRVKNIFKSLITGVVVYFALMTVALLYLMITTP